VAGALMTVWLAGMLMAPSQRTPVLNGFLQSDFDGNQFCIVNLGCLEAGSITASNINTTNLNVSTINSVSVANFLNIRSSFDPFTVVDMATNLFKSGTPNEYWIDWGHTNNLGQTNIYGTLTATADVKLHLPTNGVRGSLWSFNVVASGANRTITLETNMPHFDTNGGFALNGSSLYSLLLSNGCELRMSFQSNSTMSVLWKTTGQ
jgi:hypothetical protein